MTGLPADRNKERGGGGGGGAAEACSLRVGVSAVQLTGGVISERGGRRKGAHKSESENARAREREDVG